MSGSVAYPLDVARRRMQARWNQVKGQHKSQGACTWQQLYIGSRVRNV